MGKADDGCLLPIVFPAKACPDSFNHLTPATRRIRSAGVPRRRRFHLTRQPVGASRFSKGDGDPRSTVPHQYFYFLILTKFGATYNKYNRNYIIHEDEDDILMRPDSERKREILFYSNRSFCTFDISYGEIHQNNIRKF